MRAVADTFGRNCLLSVHRFTEARGGRYYRRHLQEVPATRSEIMAANSHIEWTEATWNPVTGCTKVSAGCKNCYAERLAFRLHAMGNPRYRNGFKITLHEDLIDLPKRWREPRLIFVNSMSDLFHEQVPLEFIQRVFATMRACSQHTFQILTKRSGRLTSLARKIDWPVNVWMGVSVEDSRVLSRVDDPRKVPAAIRFLSCEPLIGSLAGIFFFFNDTATTEIYTLSLHDALPIWFRRSYPSRSSSSSRTRSSPRN